MSKAVIVSTARTPIGKAFRGALNNVHGAALGAHVIKAAAERARIDLAEVEDVLIGHPVEHSADGNVRVGVAYLHHLLQTFGGNERLALAAWYQGEAAVRSNGIYAVTKPFVDDVLALRLRM